MVFPTTYLTNGHAQETLHKSRSWLVLTETVTKTAMLTSTPGKKGTRICDPCTVELATGYLFDKLPVQGSFDEPRNLRHILPDSDTELA
jgi:hypothetical protein